MKTQCTFIVTLFLLACGNAPPDASSSSSTSQPDPTSRVSCVITSTSNTQCSALDPTNSTKTYCQDNTEYSACVDSQDDSYGGGCFFERSYIEFPIDTDCATYEAQHPDMFN